MYYVNFYVLLLKYFKGIFALKKKVIKKSVFIYGVLSCPYDPEGNFSIVCGCWDVNEMEESFNLFHKGRVK